LDNDDAIISHVGETEGGKEEKKIAEAGHHSNNNLVD